MIYSKEEQHVFIDYLKTKNLTTRQMEVAILMLDNLPSREIGKRLGTSTANITYQLKSVYKKFGFTSRIQLVRHLRGKRGYFNRIYRKRLKQKLY